MATEHPPHIRRLLARNEHAKKLLRAGYEIVQAQGPDYDESGEPIVYERDGEPVENPPIVWFVALRPSLLTYVSDDASKDWELLAHPKAIKLRAKLARHLEGGGDPNDEKLAEESIRVASEIAKELAE
jgi:hypothetical protein